MTKEKAATKAAPAPKATPKPTPEPAKPGALQPDAEGKIRGVLVAKVDEAVLRESLINVLTWPADKAAGVSIPEAIVALVDYFEANFAPDKLADCEDEGCQGGSPTEYDACSFCGISGVNIEPEDDDKEPEDDDKEPEEDDLATVKPPAKKEPAKKEPAKKEPAPKAEKPKEDKPKEDKPKAEKKDALAKKEPAKLDIPEGVTVERLNDAVARFTGAKGEVMMAGWDLGKVALEIYEHQLWKARVEVLTAEDKTVTQKATFKSFDDFCRAELLLTPQQVYMNMDVAKGFTREQVKTWGGVSKAHIILKAPESAQPRLMEMAASHGRRSLQKAADDAAAADGGKKPRETGRKKMPTGKGGGRKGKAKGVDGLTIAMLTDKTLTIPLYQKPAKGDEPTERATTIEQKPIGFKDLEGKVTMVIGFVPDTTGALVAKVTFKALEPAAS